MEMQFYFSSSGLSKKLGHKKSLIELYLKSYTV